MEVEFRKVLISPKNFEISLNGIKFFGEFYYNKAENLVVIDAKLKGELETECDRCAKSFKLNIDENLIIKVSNGIYEGDDIDDDIFEIFNNIIDFNEILYSEIESIKSDYHICQNCKEIDTFEVEF